MITVHIFLHVWFSSLSTVYPNNDKKKLVYLGGTVPVTYEGNWFL